MADEPDPTPEQLAAIAAANDDGESGINHKPPAQKSLQEIQELDKEDESLQKYKEALLGKVDVCKGVCVCVHIHVITVGQSQSVLLSANKLRQP